MSYRLLQGLALFAGMMAAAPGHPEANRVTDFDSIVPVPLENGCPALGGLGLNYGGMVVRNPAVRRNLEALRCGLTLEGYPPGIVDVVVSGGESYVGADGKVYSLSHESMVDERRPNSAHNVERGARAVDVLRSGGISDREFYSIMERYTEFRSPHGHGLRHRHLSLGWQHDCPPALCTLTKG